MRSMQPPGFGRVEMMTTTDILLVKLPTLNDFESQRFFSSVITLFSTVSGLVQAA